MTGWFILGHVRVSEDQNQLLPTSKAFTFDYLTPYGEPVTLDVSTFMPPKTRLDDLSPKIIMDALEAVMNLPFEGIPLTPLNIPLSRIPPSRRKKLERTMRERDSYLPTTRRPK